MRRISGCAPDLIEYSEDRMTETSDIHNNATEARRAQFFVAARRRRKAEAKWSSWWGYIAFQINERQTGERLMTSPGHYLETIVSPGNQWTEGNDI
jgi:hypothetical protein